MAQSSCYGFAMSDNEHEIDKPEAEIENPGSFAVRLFHARGAHPPTGLTQAQLAERAGLQQSTIAHYESGRREPSLANLRRLVWATGQSADYLLATRPGTDADYRPDAAIHAPVEVLVVYDGGRMTAAYTDRSGRSPKEVMSAVLMERPNVVRIEICGNAESGAHVA